jgi:hypothetical protein
MLTARARSVGAGTADAPVEAASAIVKSAAIDVMCRRTSDGSTDERSSPSPLLG